jgi:cytochrome c oxidase subunit 3/cytochrome c oxidase subunit I+III
VTTLEHRAAPPLTREPAWWGMLLLIATEAALFALLLASYF